VLFTTTFEPAMIDHAPSIRHFTVAVPLPADVEDVLAEVRVQGRAGIASLKRSVESMSASRIGAPARVSVARRSTDGFVGVSCAGGSTRGILVLDEATGTVLGTAAGESMSAIAASGARLSVLCSDAVRTTRTSVVVPN
jgi:hypothetical protein